MDAISRWRTEATNLGLFPLLWFKAQNRRLVKSHQPLLYWTKYAQFPLRCRPNTTDHAVFRQIFVEREYQCLDHIRDARLIIDCGANVGYASAYFLSRFPGSHVIAVEPDPGNFELLKANLAPYGNRCRLVNSAVWSKPAGLTPTFHKITPEGSGEA
jgi:hypothetical protein